MAVHDRLFTPSPTDELLARLERPEVVGALTTLLDNADVLAFLVVALDGFLSRGEVIADSLAGGIGEMRGAAKAGGVGGGLPRLDLLKLAGDVSALAGPLAAATPALSALLTGPLGEPRTVAALSRLASALAEGADRAAAEPTGPTGVFALLRVLKDEDVSRGLGFLIQVARSLGRQLASP